MGEADADTQLEGFLKKFDPAIARRARAVLRKMRMTLPSANRLVYDNYNALAIGYAPGDKAGEGIFSIAVYPRWVTLFFLQGKGLPDPRGVLKGSGNKVRHVVLDAPADLDTPAIRGLMAEALRAAKVKLPKKGYGETIIKSVAKVQRPRKPAKETK